MDEIDSTHDELLEQYDTTPTKARLETLRGLAFTRLQELAGEAGVYAQDDRAGDLRQKLAEAGYYLGSVGDHNIYRHDTESGETEVVGSEI